MAKCSLISCFCIMLCASLAVGESMDSYVDDITLSYENGTFHCDKLVCPEGTYGCHIHRFTNPDDYHQLLRTNLCYNEHEVTLMESTTAEELSIIADINIDITAYVNSTTNYQISFSFDKQYFEGTVEVDAWPVIQYEFKNTIVDNYLPLGPLDD